MKRFVLLVALVVILPVLATLPALNASPADITAPEPEMIPCHTEADSSSASLTITMYAVDDEDVGRGGIGICHEPKPIADPLNPVLARTWSKRDSPEHNAPDHG